MNPTESPPVPDNTVPTADFASTLSALEHVVQRMENGQLGLEESVNLFQEGMHLARQAESQLLEARQKVEILLGSNDQPQPFPDAKD